MAFQAAVFRDEKCLVHGDLVYVFADPVSQTSRPVPPGLREALLAYEAGEPMVNVSLAGWNRHGEASRELRHAVFAQEQGIAADLTVDEADASAVHAVASNRFGAVVGSGRLLLSKAGIAQIGRMATHAGVRGAGVGMQILLALMDAARQRGDTEVMLHAQVSAVPFYRRAGFAAKGPVFQEAGVSHQEMVRLL